MAIARSNWTTLWLTESHFLDNDLTGEFGDQRRRRRQNKQPAPRVGLIGQAGKVLMVTQIGDSSAESQVKRVVVLEFGK